MARHRWAIGIATAVVIALVFWATRPSSGPAPGDDPAAAASRHADAELALVLPVELASTENPEHAWVRLGAMDYIASRLRGNGAMQVLPSAQVLQIAGDVTGADADEVARRLRSTTGARWIVRPRASSGEQGWVVRLRVDAAAEADRLEIEARGDTALVAAAAATDSLLRRLGRLQADAAQAPTALAETLQQIDAELLAGQLANARALVQGATPALRADPELRLREGQIEFRAGRVDVAVALFAALRAGGDDVSAGVRARAAMGLGAASIRTGDFEAAQRHYADAVAMLSEAQDDDPTLLGNAYNGRGIARLELGDEAAAIADIGRARLAMQRARNELEVATVDTNLGMLESRRGNDVRAVQQFDRALAVFERFDVVDNRVAVLQAKATAQLRMAQPAAALATIARATTHAGQLENPMLRERVGLVRTRVQIANGLLREADAGLAELVAATSGDARNLAFETLRLRLLLDRDDAAQAAALAKTLVTHDDAGGADDTILLGVQAALRVDDPAGARAWLATADAATRDAPGVRLATALVRAATGGEVPAAFAAASAAAADAGADARIRAGTAHARWLVTAGDTDRAAAILGELGTLADNDYRIAHATWTLYRAMGETEAARTAAAAVARLAGQRDPARAPVL